MLAALMAITILGHSPEVLTVPPEALVVPPDPKELWINALGHCESENKPNIKVLDTNGLYSYGRFQFQQKTWLNYGKPFGATMENIYDGELQEKVVRSMLDNGGQGHWYHCGKRVEKKLGKY